MPFQSEKQRRYLWANEPEIARDWTDTYGSKIHKASGGRIGFARGSDPRALKKRFIEIIQLMNQTSGEELTALVVEAQNIKRQLSDLARLQPSVAEGIAGIGGVRTEAPEIMAAQIKRATDPEAKIFEPGTGKEQIFEGDPIRPIDETPIIAGIDDRTRTMIQASMRMSDKHRKQLREMWKKRMGQAAGGRIGFRRGTSGAPGGGDPGMTSDPSGAGQTHGGEGPQGPINRHAGPTTKQALITGQKKKDLRDLLAQQQAEKDYTRAGKIKPGPQ